MLKRSKSKEASAAGTGSQTQRISTSSAAEAAAEAANGQRQLLAAGGNSGIQNGQRNANLLHQGSSASKSIFNASFKELKPSKSVDLTTSMSQNDAGNYPGQPGGVNDDVD